MLKNNTDRKCDKINAKYDQMQKEVEGLGGRQERVEADNKGMWAAINDMQKALAVSETTSPLYSTVYLCQEQNVYRLNTGTNNCLFGRADGH